MKQFTLIYCHPVQRIVFKIKGEIFILSRVVEELYEVHLLTHSK
jgi:hypothetical protein